MSEGSERKRKVKDLLTLHLPLVIVVAVCLVATIIEYRRAQEGVDRAWVYTFQWPIIAAFAVVIWNRYRKHGSLTRWISERYRARVEAVRAQAARDEIEDATSAAQPDPDEVAWQQYVSELRRKDVEAREAGELGSRGGGPGRRRVGGATPLGDQGQAPPP